MRNRARASGFHANTTQSVTGRHTTTTAAHRRSSTMIQAIPSPSPSPTSLLYFRTLLNLCDSLQAARVVAQHSSSFEAPSRKKQVQRGQCRAEAVPGTHNRQRSTRYFWPACQHAMLAGKKRKLLVDHCLLALLSHATPPC
jgi:hypothetical protein